METSAIKYLTNLGIESLNSMQLQAEKAILQNKNILLISPTGSGKTVAFLLPLLELLNKDIEGVQCLILTPTRELAMQIEQVWRKMGTGFKVCTFYGGHPMSVEVQSLTTPPALLIGTPGRIADHLTRRTFKLDQIQTLILDEFDKSLEFGFQEQMSFIIKAAKKLQKRVLVSATAGVQIPEFTGVTFPTVVKYETEEKNKETLTINIVKSEEKDKINTLIKLIGTIHSESAIIFCNHRDAVERTCQLLNDAGIFSIFYHGGMEQEDRERALIRFRNGSANFIVTTDLAARGLDIPQMKNVIHYHLPNLEHEFTHRNGRTARMNDSGTAYIIIHAEEKLPKFFDEQWEELELAHKYTLPKPPKFQTLYISGGKKDKLNKVDIVGFFSQKGKLEKDDLGLIEVKDYTSFAAVKREKVTQLLSLIKEEKMKGRKFKIEIAN
jgi:superfamily II DNA/RNA helicase